MSVFTDLPSFTITNNSFKPIGIIHVIDRNAPNAPVEPEEPHKDRVDPGESIVLFRTPGVSYVLGHEDSLATRTTHVKVLKDGTIRRDSKKLHGGWTEFLSGRKA